ncbi:MAG: SPOR domain-containing protein [Cocleimonas sp.]
MKDYKKTESLDTGLVGGSGIIWMFSGIVLGLMVGIGMYFLSNQNAPLLTSISSTDSVQNKITQAQEATPIKAGVTKPQQVNTKLPDTSTNKSKSSVPFSYYAVLPNLDVPVNTARPIETRVEVIAEKNQEVETVVAKQVDVEEKRPIARKSGNYLLQVASFKRKKMANLTRGRLAKKGVKAYVKKRKVKGRMWYRVVAGPVDQGNIDNWKHTAEKLGHRPMVISVR